MIVRVLFWVMKKVVGKSIVGEIGVKVCFWSIEEGIGDIMERKVGYEVDCWGNVVVVVKRKERVRVSWWRVM